jgi:hypothetical protein
MVSNLLPNLINKVTNFRQRHRQLCNIIVVNTTHHNIFMFFVSTYSAQGKRDFLTYFIRKYNVRVRTSIGTKLI